jgi:hypothetical protein
MDNSAQQAYLTALQCFNEFSTRGPLRIGDDMRGIIRNDRSQRGNLGLRTVPYTGTAVHLTAVFWPTRTVCRPVGTNSRPRLRTREVAAVYVGQYIHETRNKCGDQLQHRWKMSGPLRIGDDTSGNDRIPG